MSIYSPDISRNNNTLSLIRAGSAVVMSSLLLAACGNNGGVSTHINPSEYHNYLGLTVPGFKDSNGEDRIYTVVVAPAEHPNGICTDFGYGPKKNDGNLVPIVDQDPFGRNNSDPNPDKFYSKNVLFPWGNTFFVGVLNKNGGIDIPANNNNKEAQVKDIVAQSIKTFLKKVCAGNRGKEA
ncbi:MAG: hypothetical protein WCO33_01945 [bacterium]